MQRPIRFMERSNTMTREKRGLDSSDVGEGQQSEPKKQKVPALASVIVEALKVDSLQKLCSSLEPILRRVVSEEVERALAKLAPAMVSERLSPKQIEGPDGKNLQLRFRSRLSLPLFTGGKVEGEQGAAIHVVLIDTSTGHVVTSGPESSVKLDVVVLEGDFNNEDDDDWTQEHFESNVVKEREGKRPLLTGELQVSLKEGVGSLGELTFTDNSSWIRSRKFRLGVKVASGSCEGIRVREAKTDAFTVKDHRGELYKKHYPPRLDDDVWRLEKIGKDGSFHKRLNEVGIYKVEDFLRLVVRDSQKLRNILGSGMSNKMWDILVEHSKTCVLSGTYYVYYADNTKNTGVIFNDIYELSGLIAGGLYYSAETLSDSQKVFVDTLVKKAYENWMHVVEYDGRMLLNMKQSKRASSSRTEAVIEAPADYHVSLDQQVSLPRLPSSVPSEQTFMNSVVAVEGGVGYDENFGNRYPVHSHRSNAQMQLESNAGGRQMQLMSSSHQSQITRNDHMIGLALGQPESASCFGFQSIGSSGLPSNLISYDDQSAGYNNNRGADEFFSEEEIRMRSHEMLENDDMQQLLRLFSTGAAPANASNDSYPYSSYIQPPSTNFNFVEDRRSSGKAVVGWLKLKAALRWGIFIRKKAAERRAQLVELED
eukprot:TRINITY_DN4849_c1_g1_i3.p1 TRINITY_DN4849_c1_g1~~TRINITY_DN4849_c1_g1_i3.p1  ORF type:complete len:653 (-),score=155.34 TRINITY_DN4849_c1_g1_i3:806-2764(-)